MRAAAGSLLALGLALFVASPAAAYTDWSADARGYVLTRAQHYGQNQGALLYPLVTVEPLRLLVEGNLEAAAYGGDELYFYTDLSLLGRVVPTGCGPDSDALGCFVINEAYGEWRPWDPVRFLVGRHRLSWGPGLTYQPVEVLNPRPDITDPGFQRLGAWIAMAEATFFDVTTTLLVAPEVNHTELGVPSGVELLYGHVGGRVSWLGPGFDIAALGYADYGEGLLYGGASGSWAVWDGLVVHGQAIAHQRREIQTGELVEGSCPGIQNIGIPHREELDFSAVLGARYDFSDGTLLSAEYLHNADGMELPDFTTTLTTVELIKQQCPNAEIAPPDISQQGRPQQLSNVLLARNYAVLAGIRPSLWEWGVLEDTGVMATALVGLDDLSAAVNARVFYTFEQRTVFRLGVLLPLGVPRSQFGVLPFYYSVIGDVQVTF